MKTMAETLRIDELRRRVRVDPASIAFAALAEEYRRAGQFDDAIETCRTGLKRHPSYVSARVTLGHALLAAGRIDEARSEFETVLRTAPENLAAIRGLAGIQDAAHAPTATDAPAAATEPDPEVSALEGFLDAIQAARAPAIKPTT
jgi:tetratricopeptide (TPR) repeat protein